MLIDVTRLLIRFMQRRLPTGVDRVCLSYIRRYGASSRAFLFKAGFGRVLEQKTSQIIFKTLIGPGNGFCTANLVTASSALMPLPGRRGAGRLLFNVGHSGLERPAYSEWLLSQRIRSVFMVHDLTPINHPEFCRVGESMRHTARIRTILTTAAGIVTNSRATLEALSRFAYTSGWAMPPAVVAPLGCGLTAQSSRPNPADPPTPSGPYFVILGTIEPRKNHWMILQVWRRMVDRYGSAAPKIFVIGRRGWECENVLDLLERCAQLRGVVFELSNCSDTELACYLARARALIFPSFDEGYGLPLIESLSLGVPVLASNLPVFREIAGDIPDYLDPLDGLGWMSCIEDYCLPDSPLRAAQLERLAGFVAPTWQDHFEVVDKLLGQIQNSI